MTTITELTEERDKIQEERQGLGSTSSNLAIKEQEVNEKLKTELHYKDLEERHNRLLERTKMISYLMTIIPRDKTFEYQCTLYYSEFKKYNEISDQLSDQDRINAMSNLGKQYKRILGTVEGSLSKLQIILDFTARFDEINKRLDKLEGKK